MSLVGVLLILFFVPLGKADLSLGNQFIQLILQSGQTQDPFTISNATGSTLARIDVNGNAFTQSLNATNITAKNIGGVIYADQYATIQQAINSSSPGSIIRIPAGTYILSSTLWIPGNRIIEGEGVSTILYLANNANIALIKNEHYGSAIADENITIRNMLLDGNKANQTSLAWGLLDFAGLNEAAEGVSVLKNIRIDNVVVRNSYKIGISIAQIEDSSITNSIAYSNANSGIDLHGRYGFRAKNLLIANSISHHNGGDGIGVGWSKSVRVVHTTVYNNTFNGISVDGGEETIISENICNNNNMGIYAHGGSGISPQYYHIIGNNCANNTLDGIAISASTYTGGIISKNTAKFNNRYGIYVSGFRTNIEGNSVYNNAWDGIHLYYAHAATIANNHAISNSQNPRNVYSGIYLEDYANDLVVLGNQVHDDQAIMTQKSAITIAGTIDNSIVAMNNLFPNNGTSLNITTSGTRNTYINNFGTFPFNFGNKASAPTPFGAGDQFYNTSSNKMAYYNGTNWIQYP